MGDKSIDAKIDEIKKAVLLMGTYVENNLKEVVQALISKNINGFESVKDNEVKINQEQVRIDEMGFHLIAKMSPVAKDLRIILSILKMTTDLERMGDLTVNIAHTAKDYLKRNSLSDKDQTIEFMSMIAKKMTRQSLESFVGNNIDLAKEVLIADDELDLYKNRIFKDLVEHMKSNSIDVESSIDLILIARSLERLGDHATNIAEEVIFAHSGKDIRHKNL